MARKDRYDLHDNNIEPGDGAKWTIRHTFYPSGKVHTAVFGRQNMVSNARAGKRLA